MNKNKLIIAAAVLVVPIVTLYWFSSATKQSEKIKIGAILPMSGEYAKIGDDARKAINLALKGASNVEIIFEDSGFDSKRAVSAYQKLTSIDKIDALINLDSVSFAAIYPLIKKDNLLALQIAESNIHSKDTVFQILPSSYPLFSKLGEISNERYEKVALAYGSGEFLVKDAEFFRKGILKNKIVYDVMLNPNSDYRSEVTKLLRTNPEATTFFLSVEEGIKFLKTLMAQGGNKKIDLICDANAEISIGEYVKALGSEIFEGCASVNLPNQMTDQFRNEFRKEYGADPGFFADYSYDSALILKNIMNQPKSEWVAKIESLNLNGASGEIKFDENGTRFPASETHIFKDGKFIKLDRE